MLQPPWLDGGTSNFQIFCVHVQDRDGERDRHGDILFFFIKNPSLTPEVGKH